jgi:hypothetical protein
VPTGPISLDEIAGEGDRGKKGRDAGAATRPDGKRRRDKLRYRVLPRSVLGISGLILAFAIGAGFSGVVLYSYYQYKLNQTNSRVNALISGYKTQFANAEGNLNYDVSAAKASIANQLKALQQTQTSPQQLAGLIKQVAPSVYFVHTLDASGQAAVGAAFAVSSNSSETLLLSSYTTVAAATHAPAPAIFVRQGNSDTQVTLQTWDTQYDLALLVLHQGGVPVLPLAPSSPSPQPGDRLFAVSGLGSAGASISQATVVDVSTNGLALVAGIGPAFQGGPIVNQSGQVIGVGSRHYNPEGFTSDGVWYSPYVQAACSKVLSCPGGTLGGSH